MNTTAPQRAIHSARELLSGGTTLPVAHILMKLPNRRVSSHLRNGRRRT